MVETHLVLQSNYFFFLGPIVHHSNEVDQELCYVDLGRSRNLHLRTAFAPIFVYSQDYPAQAPFHEKERWKDLC